jgi:hypothetical protein
MALLIGAKGPPVRHLECPPKAALHATGGLLRNCQVDLVSPDDAHFECSAVATDLSLHLRASWDFMAGRGVQAKTLAELKGEFAFDGVPYRYVANNAWQQLHSGP